MTKRMIVPLLVGLVGTLILVSLGNWQVRRLAEKEAYIAAVEARLGDAPAALPTTPDPVEHRFLPVELTGSLGDRYIRVLVSQKGRGAGYRIISPFQVGDRTVLLDRGFIGVEDELPALPSELTVTGNLHWPDEIDSFTPEPDLAENIWFARDVGAMADALGTEPVLIIMRTSSVETGSITPLPVTTEGIPNDHLEYLVTWYSLAVVWFGMTLYLLWRIRRQTI